MDNNPKVVWSGFGLCDILLVIFIVLKLTKVIAWSWWWVLSPLWIPVGLILGILIFIFVAAGIVIGIATLLNK